MLTFVYPNGIGLTLAITISFTIAAMHLITIRRAKVASRERVIMFDLSTQLPAAESVGQVTKTEVACGGANEGARDVIRRRRVVQNTAAKQKHVNLPV